MVVLFLYSVDSKNLTLMVPTYKWFYFFFISLLFSLTVRSYGHQYLHISTVDRLQNHILHTMHKTTSTSTSEYVDHKEKFNRQEYVQSS